MFTNLKEALMAQRRLSGSERRAQIIEKATRLFARDGFKKVTMGMLARSCRVTEPALYRHFASKQDLYSEVLVSLKDRLNIHQVLDDLDKSDDIEEVLDGLAMYVVKTYSANTELSRLLLFSALEGHPQAHRTFQDLRGLFVVFLTKKLRSLKRAKKIRNIHPEITARCFMGMVMDCALGLHLWQTFQKNAYNPERIVRNNVPIFAAGLRRK